MGDDSRCGAMMTSKTSKFQRYVECGILRNSKSGDEHCSLLSTTKSQEHINFCRSHTILLYILMSSSNVIIRTAEASDGPDVARIWVAGLSQTIENSWRIFQPLLRWAFDKSAKESLSEEGDLGPDGANLIKIWVGPADRTFVVAVENGTVVGCVGVKKKGSQNDHDVKTVVTEETKVAAIYRLSVDESARRKGIAKSLMNKAHEWAKEEAGCESMWLPTMNPRAADFYKAIGYKSCHWSGLQFSKDL